MTPMSSASAATSTDPPWARRSRMAEKRSCLRIASNVVQPEFPGRRESRELAKLLTAVR